MCEACDTDEDALICEGCGCCQECCNCTPTDCDCEACEDRRAVEEPGPVTGAYAGCAGPPCWMVLEFGCPRCNPSRWISDWVAAQKARGLPC